MAEQKSYLREQLESRKAYLTGLHAQDKDAWLKTLATKPKVVAPTPSEKLEQVKLLQTSKQQAVKQDLQLSQARIDSQEQRRQNSTVNEHATKLARVTEIAGFKQKKQVDEIIEVLKKINASLKKAQQAVPTPTPDDLDDFGGGGGGKKPRKKPRRTRNRRPRRVPRTRGNRPPRGQQRTRETAEQKRTRRAREEKLQSERVRAEEVRTQQGPRRPDAIRRGPRPTVGPTTRPLPRSGVPTVQPGTTARPNVLGSIKKAPSTIKAALKNKPKLLGKGGGLLTAGLTAYEVANIASSDMSTEDKLKAGGDVALEAGKAWAGAEAGGMAGAALGTMVGGPIGTAVGGFAGSVLGSIYGPEAIDAAVAKIQNAVQDSGVSDIIGRGVATVISPFSEDARQALYQDYQTKIAPVLEGTYEDLKTTLVGWGKNAEELGKGFEDFTDAVGEGGSTIWSSIKSGASNIIEGFKDASKELVDGAAANATQVGPQGPAGDMDQMTTTGPQTQPSAPSTGPTVARAEAENQIPMTGGVPSLADQFIGKETFPTPNTKGPLGPTVTRAEQAEPDLLGLNKLDKQLKPVVDAQVNKPSGPVSNDLFFQQEAANKAGITLPIGPTSDDPFFKQEAANKAGTSLPTTLGNDLFFQQEAANKAGKGISVGPRSTERALTPNEIAINNKQEQDLAQLDKIMNPNRVENKSPEQKKLDAQIANVEKDVKAQAVAPTAEQKVMDSQFQTLVDAQKATGPSDDPFFKQEAANKAGIVLPQGPTSNDEFFKQEAANKAGITLPIGPTSDDPFFKQEAANKAGIVLPQGPSDDPFFKQEAANKAGIVLPQGPSDDPFFKAAAQMSASAKQVPVAMTPAGVPDEVQDVEITNQPTGGKVSSSGSQQPSMSSAVELAEIPLRIDDCGLILLNLGHAAIAFLTFLTMFLSPIIDTIDKVI